MTSLEAWREALAQTFVPLEVTPLGDGALFRGQVQAERVADLQLSVVSGSSQVVRRTRRLVQSSASDLYKVGLQLRGRGLVEQTGRVAQLAPGDLTIYDTARPYELIFERDFEMLVLVVPRPRLATRAPRLADLTAVTISGSHGSGALTSALLRGLDPRAARTGLEAAYLSDAAVDLLAACLAGCGDTRAQEPCAETVVAAAQSYIEAHLSDATWHPAEVAAGCHVSFRHLQRLFEHRGTTISGRVRERRLERCWRDLVDPRLAQRPIAAVAASWGLIDAAQFSRAFRARYGMAPSTHRAEAIFSPM